MVKSYEDLKLELVLGFANPNDKIPGTNISYDNIMNPIIAFENNNLCQFVLFDTNSKIFIKQAEIIVYETKNKVEIRARNYNTDKFIKYELDRDTALKQFLIIKNVKALKGK